MESFCRERINNMARRASDGECKEGDGIQAVGRSAVYCVGATAGNEERREVPHADGCPGGFMAYGLGL
jgi:hypothetical protein